MEDDNSKREMTVDESLVTMVDVLEQEKELEEESAAVLGGSDEKECTYSKGYIKRQALYSCLTCSPEARTEPTKSAGVCLACSYQCHEHHELVELYTKRNFRCDCPTQRISGNKCTFSSEQSSSSSSSSDVAKCEPNRDNSYNQNFSGIYCTCKRPYPDPEDSIPDEMIQCIMCEDWYHTRHLDAVIPSPDAYVEMVCADCMNNFKFLKDYAGLAVNKVDSTAENMPLNVTATDEEKLRAELDRSISDILPNILSNDNSLEDQPAAVVAAVTVPPATEASAAVNGTASDSGKDGSPPAKKAKLETNAKTCRRPVLANWYKKGGIFWPENWRLSLCSCQACLQLYESQNAGFLLDPEDTVQFYEENGLKKARESDYERGIRALSNLDRTRQIDAITQYNRMKDRLKDYLQTFVVNQKVVTEDDINRFFQDMKREQTEPIGQPYFCR